MSRAATGRAAHGAVDGAVSTALPDARTRRMLNDAPLSLLIRMASPNALAAMALVFPGLMLMQMLANGAFGGAVTSAIARALGAGRDQRRRRVCDQRCAVLALFPTAWAGMFTDDPETLLSAVRYLELAGPFFAFQGLGLSLYFASQGAGTSFTSARVSGCCSMA